jgi:hypothetical protein
MEELVKRENVESVYFGRHGCCCGCRGTHTRVEPYRGDPAGNPGTITRAVNRVNRVLSGEDDTRKLDDRREHHGYIAVETDERITIVYLRPTDA